MPLILFIILFFSSLSWSKYFDLHCKFEGNSSEMHIITSLKTRILQWTDDPDYWTIYGGTEGAFNLFLYDNQEGTLTPPLSDEIKDKYLWHSEVAVPIFHQENSSKYQSPKYLNHIKWKNLVRINGKADFLFPKNAITLLTNNDRQGIQIPAYLILVSIKNHFEATIPMNCCLSWPTTTEIGTFSERCTKKFPDLRGFF